MKMHNSNGKITRHLSCVHDEMRDGISATVPRNNILFCFLGGVLKGCKIVGRCRCKNLSVTTV
jgi:hypothetical protein